MHKARYLLLALALTLPWSAHAWQVELRGDLGLERVSGQSLSALNAGVELTHDSLNASWTLPLRADLLRGQLRARDWDEAGEWTRVLPRVTWRKPQGSGRLTAFQLRLGPTSGASLGHGTIVRDYRSALLADHFKTALQVDADVSGVGLQVLVGDVARAGLVASRLFFRPGGRLTIGVSAVADRQAPVANLSDPSGQRRVAVGQRPAQQTAPLVIAGVDLSVPFELGVAHHLVPYLDLNVATVADGGGAGAHAGVWWTRSAGDVTVQARWELRLSTGSYRPGWIDGFYELERAQLAGGAPKAQQWLNRADSQLAGHLVELNARWSGWHASAAWETWHSAPNRPEDTLALRLTTPIWWGAQGRVSWSMRPGEDQHAVGFAGHWQARGPWHAFVRINRSWAAEDGRFATVWNAAAGGGLRWRW